MDRLFDEAIVVMGEAFRTLERSISPPKMILFRGTLFYRFGEKSVEQALIQKLARLVSGLHAIRLLLNNGYLQEQGVLQRTLDELNEDIYFLAIGIIDNDITELHKKYLETFYAEPKIVEGIEGSQTPRKKTRFYLATRKDIRIYLRKRFSKESPDPLIKGDEAIDNLSDFYSGFVHAASPQIMDMCFGNPPRFKIAGMLGTPLVDSSRGDAWNYYFRALQSFVIVARALGDKVLEGNLQSYMKSFEEMSGTNYTESARKDLGLD